MIKFNDSPDFNTATLPRRMAYFNSCIRIIQEYEWRFIPEIKKQLLDNHTVPVMWPDSFVNELYVEYERGLQYLSLQGRNCGIRVTPSQISVHVWGQLLFVAPTDMSKDEYFNLYLMDNMNNVRFDNIQYIQQLYSTLYGIIKDENSI